MIGSKCNSKRKEREHILFNPIWGWAAKESYLGAKSPAKKVKPAKAEIGIDWYEINDMVMGEEKERSFDSQIFVRKSVGAKSGM